MYYINDEQLLEGIIASIAFPGLVYFCKNTSGLTFILCNMITFFLYWLLRKLFLNHYILHKENKEININNNFSDNSYLGIKNSNIF